MTIISEKTKLFDTHPLPIYVIIWSEITKWCPLKWALRLKWMMLSASFCSHFLFNIFFSINHIFKRIARGNPIKFSIKNCLLFIYTYVKMIICTVCHRDVFWSMRCFKMGNIYQITSVAMLPRRHISMLYLNLKNCF